MGGPACALFVLIYFMSVPTCIARRRRSVASVADRSLSGRACPVSLARVRQTEFWERMRAQFGEAYAESVAKDHALSALGSRTVRQALAEGEDVKVVWRAVCEAFRVPERLR